MTPTVQPATSPVAVPAWFPLRWQLEPSIWAGLQGETPLPWWSGGWYAGPLRELVLEQRRQPDAASLAAPVEALLQQVAQVPLIQPAAPPWRELLLVPIPGWRRQPNPVPALLARLLVEALNRQDHAPALPCRQQPELLLRRGWVAPQRWLGRQQRWRNQWLSFCSLLPADPAHSQRAGVLLVDDVLTSGATALAARQALQSAGWSVAGLLCLARTPRRAARRDLRSSGQGARLF
jgi:predicted amidophosphoribosyltransferase